MRIYPTSLYMTATSLLHLPNGTSLDLDSPNQDSFGPRFFLDILCHFLSDLERNDEDLSDSRGT